MPKQKKKDNQKNLKLAVLAVLILVLVGVGAYALVQSYSKTPTTQTENSTQQSAEDTSTSDAEAKREAGAVLSKVKMEMTKDEVIATVGQPQSCRTSTPQEEDDKNIMETCSYGKKDAPGHASIVFMNGRVWGTSYEAGPIYTDR